MLDSAPFAGHQENTGLLHAHMLVMIKSCIVLASWIFGYFGLKHLPITIVGPINATRPVMVLVGAMLIFGERLNWCQWTGVVFAVISLFMLSRSSRKESVDFVHDKWIMFVAVSAVIGAVSGLYDKYIMTELSPMFVQGWYNFYQMVMMAVVIAILWYPHRKKSTPFHWSWAIPLISLFISAADFSYLTALKPSGLDDFCRFPCQKKFRDSLVHLRSADFQGKEPESQGSGPASDSDRNDIHLFRVEMRGNGYFAGFVTKFIAPARHVSEAAPL